MDALHLMVVDKTATWSIERYKRLVLDLVAQQPDLAVRLILDQPETTDKNARPPSREREKRSMKRKAERASLTPHNALQARGDIKQEPKVQFERRELNVV